MKILHIINNLGSGGAEKLIEDLVPLLNKQEGIKVDVLLLTDKNNVFDKRLIDESIHINVIPLKRIYSLLNIYHIRKHIIKGEYDIVHVHLFPSQYWSSIATKLIFKNRPKLITTEHSTNNRRREKSYFKYLDKYIYNSYDKIISISEKAQNNLMAWLDPIDKDISRFRVIHNGIDLVKFNEAKPYKKSQLNSNFNENTKIICMVGRFTDAKDQGTIIKSIKTLPEDIHILLIGEGPLKGENKRLSAELGIDERVHFLGFRNDIDRILKTSDIIILSSYWEGLSLSSIEGMASGKPFIGSDAPGLREVIEGAGMIFPIGDCVVLAKLIMDLLSDRDQYNNTVKKCMSRASDYSIEGTSTSYVRVYEELLK